MAGRLFLIFNTTSAECADAFSAPSTKDRAEILSGAKHDCC